MDDKPLTSDDLYGKSTGVASEPSPQKPLAYEETPIIEPIQGGPTTPQYPYSPPVQASPPITPPVESIPQLPKQPMAPRSSSSFMNTFGMVLFFILLFAVGVWLSTILRQYIPSGVPAKVLPTPEQSGVTPGIEATISQPPPDSMSSWKSYQVVSGVTKQVISGISFKLPSEVLAPICDGANCASQGTYLPGGSRLTVAARGKGQLLTDYRGRIVSDLAGKEFMVKQTTVAGKNAVDFTGLFTGTTVGGYAFAQMHGVMVEVDDTLSLEINHFTPSGVSADFVSDDRLFEKIVGTVVFTGFTSLQKGAQITTPTSTQSASPSAQ
ncbi:hypothetical protein HY409_00290 [Candidatus Gottesmanbacteria bacterium]|nr:hypothetical protein [Candidatus Gottesmanbacteria bacterium]